MGSMSGIRSLIAFPRHLTSHIPLLPPSTLLEYDPAYHNHFAMWFTSKLSAFHSSLFGILRLRHPVNRPYERKSLTYAAYGFMLIVVCILIPVNYALQGYEPITTNKQDPHTTSVYWYHAFTGNPKPGSQCDDHLFSLGDTFQTSIGTLSYTLQSILYNSSDGIRDWGGTTIPYKGLSTDFCDVTFLGLGFSPALTSVTSTATIQCIHEDFQVNASTSVDVINSIAAPPSSPLFYLYVAFRDLWDPFVQDIPGSNIKLIDAEEVTISVLNPLSWFCPMFLIKNETDIDVAAIDLNATSLPFCTPQEYDQPAVNGSMPVIIISGNSSHFDLVFRRAVYNYMEVFASVVRYDLGSRLPGNFLVNPSAVLSQNQSFLPVATFNGTNLTTIIQDEIGVHLPLAQSFNASTPNQPAPPTLPTTYECHLTVPKSAGSAAVSVIVATITIGATIWKVLMLVVASFAKVNIPGANHSEHYALEEGLPKSLNASEEHLVLRERSDLQQLLYTTT